MSADNFSGLLGQEAKPSINKLTVHTYPCTGQPLQSEPLVLIHGWGADSGTWELILPELTRTLNILAIDLPGFGQSDVFKLEAGACSEANTEFSWPTEHYLDAILAIMPNKCSIMGWSLGGALATALAGRHPSRFSNLITVATNPCFTRQPGWSFGMPGRIFKDFVTLFNEQPAVCLRRFHALQCRGDTEERKLFRLLQKGVTERLKQFTDRKKNSYCHNAWLRGLELLAEIDNRDTLRKLKIPGLHIFGEVDQLVNLDITSEFEILNSLQQIKIIPKAGHLLHISNTKKVASSVLSFLKEKRYFLDKKRVADSFSRAANSYDSVSRLQRQVGEKLLNFLPDRVSQNTVIDLGCGTGFFVKPLANKYNSATIVGMDLAEGMLEVARSRHDSIDLWLCGDAENIPLADNSVDIIFSNLTFQWCDQLPLLAHEISRVVKPGGRVAFTSLGSKTLSELRESWIEVDSYVHVNQFLDPHSWKTAFSQAGFDIEDYEIEDHKLTYRDLSHLMKELKDLGAHNLNAGQNKGMTGSKNIRNLVSAYDKFRDSRGQLPATWQVIYGVCTLNV